MSDKKSVPSPEISSTIPDSHEFSNVQAGAGKAYQAVAQSTAISIQDAADYLRNMNAICVTSVGVAMAKYIETGNAQYGDVIKSAQETMQYAVKNYEAIGNAASRMLNDFPSGDKQSN